MNSQEIMNLFFYRKNPFAIKTDAGYRPVYRDITISDIQRHLIGDHTIGAYQSKEDETCMWACIDIDYKSKKIKSTIDSMILLLKSSVVTGEDTVIQDSLLEESNKKGYHIWIFFKEPQRTENAYDILLSLLRGYSLAPSRDSKIDIFPRSPHLNGKRVGSMVRIPR